MRQGQAMLVTSADFGRLLEAGEVESRFVEWEEWMGAPLFDPQGKVFGLVTLISFSAEHRYKPQDVEILSIVAAQIAMVIKRLQVEQALRDGQAKYHSLVEQSFEALALVDIDTREVVEVNYRFTEMHGYALPEDAPLHVDTFSTEPKADLDRTYGTTLRQQALMPLEPKTYRHKNGIDVHAERAGRVIGIKDRDYLLVSLRDMAAERRRQAVLSRDVEFARRVQLGLLPNPTFE